MTLQETFYAEKGYSCNYDKDGYISWLEKLVEEKFTSHNTARDEICPSCKGSGRGIPYRCSHDYGECDACGGTGKLSTYCVNVVQNKAALFYCSSAH